MMLGTMGSGKSSFARQLAVKIGGRRINADIIRRGVFKTYEEWTKPENKELVFIFLNQHVEQALKTGCSVIRDYQHDSWQEREEVRQMAHKCGALPVIVWLKIPAETAIERTIARPDSPDSIKFDEAFIRDAVKRHLERLESPTNRELYVEIDGRLPFENQYETFAAFIQAC